MRLSTYIFILLFILSAAPAIAQTGNWDFNSWMNHLERPGDTIYIQDRKQLFKLKGYTCNGEQSSFTSKTPFADTIVICFKTRKFNAADHKVDLNDTVFKYINNERRIDYFKGKNQIDGKYAYGADGDEPRIEFSFIEIIWGRLGLEIPEKAYKDLFDAHLCKNYVPVEAYITNNGKLLFIYFCGSDGAGAYTAKLVFNRKRYVTRIINTNEMSTGYDFLDCTAK